MSCRMCVSYCCVSPPHRYVTPGSKQVTALQDLGQAEPLEGEDLAHLKNRLAAGAAEALELQLRSGVMVTHTVIYLFTHTGGGGG